MLAPSDIPARFWSVGYDGTRIPGDETPDLTLGANCQVFAYALLRHFGRALPPFRSSELWDDTTHTLVVSEPFEALDLLLFNATPEAWGAHMAVSLGGDQAIHLSQRVGRPVVWTLDRFAEEADYRVLVGAKRLR